MGRKVLKDRSLVMTNEKTLVVSSYLDHEINYRDIQAWHNPSERRGEENTCEFKDYCNRLYYIDGKCRCMTTWKRSAGLALPLSV